MSRICVFPSTLPSKQQLESKEFWLIFWDSGKLAVVHGPKCLWDTFILPRLSPLSLDTNGFDLSANLLGNSLGHVLLLHEWNYCQPHSRRYYKKHPLSHCFVQCEDEGMGLKRVLIITFPVWYPARFAQIQNLFILKLDSYQKSNLNVWYLRKISYCGIFWFCAHNIAFKYHFVIRSIYR